MFEKEAEEYGEKDLGGKYLSSVVAKDKLHAYKLGQYDGFVAGAEFGYNKANEWHYVKDEEKRIFEEWFEEKKEKCEVYGNGDDFWVDDEIKKFCLMGYELGLKAGRP